MQVPGHKEWIQTNTGCPWLMMTRCLQLAISTTMSDTSRSLIEIYKNVDMTYSSRIQLPLPPPLSSEPLQIMEGYKTTR